MRIADLTTGSAKLASAFKTLQLHWEDTKEHWQDSTASRFEENYLEPLGPQIAAAMEAVARLAEVLAHAQRDCE